MASVAYDRRYVRHVTQMLFQVLIVTVTGAFVRVLALGQHAIFLDEAISLEIVTRNSLPALTAFLRQWDVHPPLYYQILLLWTRIMGTDLVFLRLPSALFGILTAPAIYVLTTLLTRRRTAFLAAQFFALSPLQLFVAQEARMYSLLTLWTVLAFICLVAILKQGELADARVFWLGLAACQAGALYTHSAGGLYLTASLNGAVAWLLWRARRGVAFPDYPALNALGLGFNWGAMQAIVALLWLPWFGAFLQQMQRVLQEFWIQPLDPYVAWGAVVRMAFAFLPLPADYQALCAGFLLALAAVGAARLRRRPVPLALLLSGFLAPLACAWAGEALRPLWHERSLNGASVFLYVLAAVGLAGPAPTPRRTWSSWRAVVRMAPAAGQILLAVLLTLIQLWGVIGYRQTGEREAWRQAATLVADRAQAGDVAVFQAHWTELPFMYHYARLSGPALEPLPLPEAAFVGNVTEPRMSPGALAVLDARLAPQARAWLVYSHDWYTDPDQILLEALHARRAQVAAWTLRGMRVYLFAAE